MPLFDRQGLVNPRRVGKPWRSGLADGARESILQQMQAAPEALDRPLRLNNHSVTAGGASGSGSSARAPGRFSQEPRQHLRLLNLFSLAQQLLVVSLAQQQPQLQQPLHLRLSLAKQQLRHLVLQVPSRKGTLPPVPERKYDLAVE